MNYDIITDLCNKCRYGKQTDPNKMDCTNKLMKPVLLDEVVNVFFGGKCRGYRKAIN